MKIVLICNTQYASNMSFPKDMSVEIKKKLTSLNSKGVEDSKILKYNVKNIYCPNYISCIETAKYLSEYSSAKISLSGQLNDCRIGDHKNQSAGTLAFFQEKNMSFKFEGGESLNECGDRLYSFIKLIKEDCAIIIPRKVLVSYLTRFYNVEFNENDRLILTKDGEVVIDGSEFDLKVFELTIENNRKNIVKEI